MCTKMSEHYGHFPFNRMFAFFGLGPARTHLRTNFPILKSLYCIDFQKKTSQELRMLSSVTLYCQATKIVMNRSGSTLLRSIKVTHKGCQCFPTSQ